MNGHEVHEFPPTSMIRIRQITTEENLAKRCRYDQTHSLSVCLFNGKDITEQWRIKMRSEIGYLSRFLTNQSHGVDRCLVIKG